jgi:septum formation protein
MRIILASGSPRRRELMEMLLVKNLEIIPAKGEELPHPELGPAQLVKELSRAKAAEVYEKNTDALVIGADTVVAVDGVILGKPRDEQDARRMLRLLSGREHEVFTGMTVIKDGRTQSIAERTAVRFRTLSDEEISAYIATGEPMDKAGAYGIQGIGSLLIRGIDGDFYNVMGLPVCTLGTILKALGVNLL